MGTGSSTVKLAPLYLYGPFNLFLIIMIELQALIWNRCGKILIFIDIWDFTLTASSSLGCLKNFNSQYE